MSNEPGVNQSQERRCPTCDAVVPAGEIVCVMCGTAVPLPPPPADAAQTVLASQPLTQADKTAVSQTAPTASAAKTPDTPTLQPLTRRDPAVVESILRERRSLAVPIMTGLFLLITAVLGGLILRYQEPVALVQFVPTMTSIPPTATYTLTPTSPPTETAAPSLTPTITSTPLPTETPRPPRIHVVSSGETLIGLSVVYRVSPESIAEANDFELDTAVQVNQNLNIPWPTATPPLEVLALEVNGETVVLDPRNCEQVIVQEGDSLVGIAARYGLNFEWLVQLNRLTNPELLQPGDVVCIPAVYYGNEGILPPTPGPSPTPTATSLPSGPRLLSPADGATFADPTILPLLQWVVVKDLAEDELYMVEMVDEAAVGAPAYRGFTPDTVFELPVEWRPTVAEERPFRWRVAIVQVTGYRSDGVPIYTQGGRYSQFYTFNWLGVVPTATPVPTQTPTSTPTPGS